MKKLVAVALGIVAFSAFAADEPLTADRVLLMTCLGMDKGIPRSQKIPKPSDQECALIRHAKGVPDTAEPKIGNAAPVEKSPPPMPPVKSPVAEKCSNQAEFFAKVVAMRQENVGASTVYGMVIDGETRSKSGAPSAAKADWYRKTILAVYNNPKYLFADPSAAGMTYEDSCNSEPGVMLIQE